MSNRIQHVLAFAACAASTFLAACGDDDHHEAGCGLEANCTDTVDFAAGLVREGNDGNLRVKLVAADPAPPAGGELDVDAGSDEGAYVNNRWTVQVVDDNGDPIAGANVTSVRTWSMDCMHFGLDADDSSVVVTDNGNDTFSWTHQYLHGGPWSVRVSVSANGETDLVEFPFCLEETGAHHH